MASLDEVTWSPLLVASGSSVEVGSPGCSLDSGGASDESGVESLEAGNPSLLESSGAEEFPSGSDELPSGRDDPGPLSELEPNVPSDPGSELKGESSLVRPSLEGSHPEPSEDPSLSADDEPGNPSGDVGAVAEESGASLEPLDSPEEPAEESPDEGGSPELPGSPPVESSGSDESGPPSLDSDDDVRLIEPPG